METLPLAKHFIEQGIKLMQINEYLRNELSRAGFAGIDLQKTPLGVRITLKTSRPGLVIGKGGKRIREITEELEERFELEMPQIEVEEVQNPSLDAQIMAERLAYSLDRGRHYRRAGYYILRRIMDAGAKGCEIRIAGKITSQRARAQIFRAGTMKKSGQPAQEAVDKGVAQCIQKSGTLGIIVKIFHANYDTGDEVIIKRDLLQKTQKEIESKKPKTKAEKLKAGEYLVEESEAELTEEEKELIDEVDEEEVAEASIETEEESEEE
ncbi:MAG: 30S ribosomal protein S3 [Promethearchaeota archaeon]|jgi:small subunit ribosomal protein S3|nr:MAG: 30S ribosomal protein S3 [Candidatus Lokiarchaeota archaeon]